MKRKVASFYKKRMVIFEKKNSSNIRIEVSHHLVKMVLPSGIDYKELVRKHMRWLKDKINVQKEAFEISKSLKLTPKSEEVFLGMVKEIVLDYSEKLDVPVKSIRLRYMKTKWGSWSTKNILTLNKFLRFLPEKLIRYVILHELTHFFEPFHTEEFYNLLERHIENVPQLEKMLSAYWIKLERSGVVRKFIS
ncbi:MAG: M48 family metallopeptidase [Actinobacteria bacterium]|nr:M48 family metallopeptidase [Actinomycetota bacterium]